MLLFAGGARLGRSRRGRRRRRRRSRRRSRRGCATAPPGSVLWLRTKGKGAEGCVRGLAPAQPAQQAATHHRRAEMNVLAGQAARKRRVALSVRAEAGGKRPKIACFGPAQPRSHRARRGHGRLEGAWGARLYASSSMTVLQVARAPAASSAATAGACAEAGAWLRAQSGLPKPVTVPSTSKLRAERSASAVGGAAGRETLSSQAGNAPGAR